MSPRDPQATQVDAAMDVLSDSMGYIDSPEAHRHGCDAYKVIAAEIARLREIEWKYEELCK